LKPAPIATVSVDEGQATVHFPVIIAPAPVSLLQIISSPPATTTPSSTAPATVITKSVKGKARKYSPIKGLTTGKGYTMYAFGTNANDVSGALFCSAIFHSNLGSDELLIIKL